MKKIYKKVNETGHVYVSPAERVEACSLKNAIEVNVDGKLFCFAPVGQMKHRDALQLCASLNAKLPLPKSIKEHNHFIESFKRLGIEEKMLDYSTKIVLDVRRVSKDVFKRLTKISNKTDESLSFENWALGQPNNFGNDQNFVSISYPNFKWGDWSGDTIGDIICQQEIKGKNERLKLLLKLLFHKLRTRIIRIEID